MTEPDEYDLLYLNRTVTRPSFGTWARHFLLLGVTLCTATVAGLIYPFGSYSWIEKVDPQTFGDFLQLPLVYLGLIGDAIRQAAATPGDLVYGFEFSFSLLFILICHEMGHYVMCRKYHVDAKLPFFIPTPPMIGPAGTFGAFIKIRSPMPSRRAVFDIGVAGPIAGFIALIPIAIIGVATMRMLPPQPAGDSAPLIVFSDPLLIKAIAWYLGKDVQFAMGNAFYFASWVGLLVTALNLIPTGQLDGGHALYSLLG